MKREEILRLLLNQAQLNGFEFRQWFRDHMDASWAGMEQALALLARRDVEVEHGVVVGQPLVVRQLRACRVVQRHGSGLHVLIRAEGAATERYGLQAGAGVGHRLLPALRGAGSAAAVELGA